MQTSYNGRAALAREEGCVLSAYKDSVGVLTIGIGHTSRAGPPVVTPSLWLTLDECFELFAKDLAKYEAAVNTAVRVPITQSQFDALVSLCYNIGQGALKGSSLLRKLNARDYQGCADGFRAWNKAGGKVSAGLAGRRERERNIFLTANYGDLSGLPVWEKRNGKAKKMPFPKAASPMPDHDQPVIEPAPAPVLPPPVLDAHPASPADPEPPQPGFWARLAAFFARLFAPRT